MNKNRLIYLIIFSAALFFLFSGCTGVTPAPSPEITPAKTTPAAGAELPPISLTTPTNESTRSYLGLSGAASKTFSPAQIECDLLLIEIFSMYCPYCQREAPAVNQLFQLMQNNPKLSRRIKLIGIGVGNSAFEVGIFKHRYNIEFPLFADENYIIHNHLGRVRTPFFIAVANRGAEKNQILLTKLGDFSSPEIFLKTLIKLIKTQTKGEN